MQSVLIHTYTHAITYTHIHIHIHLHPPHTPYAVRAAEFRQRAGMPMGLVGLGGDVLERLVILLATPSRDGGARPQDTKLHTKVREPIVFWHERQVDHPADMRIPLEGVHEDVALRNRHLALVRLQDRQHLNKTLAARDEAVPPNAHEPFAESG